MEDLVGLQWNSPAIVFFTDETDLGTDLRVHTLVAEAKSGDQSAVGDYDLRSR